MSQSNNSGSTSQPTSSQPARAKASAEQDESRATPFVMVCCHHGAESPLKKDAAAQGWRLAFSRPGFVTFKHEPLAGQTDSFAGVFARTVSWSMGRIVSDHSRQLADQLVELLNASKLVQPFDSLHVWSRDRMAAGERGYEPSIEPLSTAVAEELQPRLVDAGWLKPDSVNQVLQVGERSLDCVMIDPGIWMIGWHAATRFAPTRWPGGFPPLDPEHDAVSRAYFKAAEAILWSELPISADDVVVEIGSAPGGASQRMLELGLKVIGVDPADMDPEIEEHPNFRHVRARGGDVKRSEYSEAKWLLVDSNVRPDKTLVTVENIVTNRQVSIRGMLLTMKLGNYSAAHRIPGWCHMIAGWGYKQIEVRQLATGRCEVCIAARR